MPPLHAARGQLETQQRSDAVLTTLPEQLLWMCVHLNTDRMLGLFDTSGQLYHDRDPSRELHDDTTRRLSIVPGPSKCILANAWHRSRRVWATPVCAESRHLAS